MAKVNYNINNRLKKIRHRMSGESAGAFLVTDERDVSYLSGFGGDSSWLVVCAGDAYLITDGRYGQQAAGECAGIEIIVRDGLMTEALVKLLKGRGVRSIAYQADKMTVAVMTCLRQALGFRKLRPIGGLVAELRAVKDESELKLIRKAAIIAQNAFCELISRGAKFFVGKTECQIAAELIYLLRHHGAQEEAFAPIIAAGANSSMPHYRPGNVKIKKGDPILFDWGACHKGYRSDLTRVVFMGTIPPEIRKMYRVVLLAQQAGIRAIRPGVSCKAVDRAARKIICDAGYGERFSHSLGHGIGLDVHEGPTLSGLSAQRLKKGMVVTVEPGIYISGTGGVRIEDDIAVTADSSRRITNLKSDIESMVL